MANVLTRKVGPAPVWAWAIVGAAAVWFLFLRAPSSAAGQTTQVPVGATTAGAGSGAGPAADAGSSADGDLLGQLLQAQQNTIDSLTGAFVGGGSGSTNSGDSSGQGQLDSGAAPSSVQQSGPAADPTVPPPSVVGGTAPMYPVAVSQAAAYQGTAPASYLNADGSYSNFEGALPSWTSDTDQSDAVSRYLANRDALSTFSSSTPVASPTPTVVQPAPIDTSHALRAGTTNVAV